VSLSEVDRPDVGRSDVDDGPRTFDVCGELPRGTTVLEASAGTGKTFTIAALVARYLAEGHVVLGELLVVTFGRMATDELRVRVRERLVGLERVLVGALRGKPLPPGTDEVDSLLSRGDLAVVAERHARVRAALSDFDAATIATTHEFCLRMLDGLGVLGNREPDAAFTEWFGDLTNEVARDVYLRRYAASGDPPFPFDDAATLADQVVNSPHARLMPDLAAGPAAGPGPEPAWRRRVSFATEVRAEVQRRKVAAGLFGYDDMLTRLRDALADPNTGALAAARLRERYRIVLVDEFQDTDVVQWEILRRAFAGHATLIMIGDPKQAIYAFRGADVYSYLDARRRADDVATLGTNWRSDRVLTDALAELIGGTSLGHADIVVRPVASSHVERRLQPGRSGRSGPDAEGRLAPLRLRVVPPLIDDARMPVAELRRQVQADLVADITELLAAAPQLALPPLRGSGRRAEGGGSVRTLQPSDVAVLVRKNERGEAIRDALLAEGVPAVMLGSASVFCAPVATEWLTLLIALEQPRQALARSAALTCFLGWSFAELAEADEAASTELAQRIREWSSVLAARGVAALLELVTVQTRLAERLLAQSGGERTLTDLRHIAQELHAAMTLGRLGVSALVDWLRNQIDRARLEIRTESTRRLETDDEAVQILTLHRSKGLQFPVIYLPEAWDSYSPSQDDGAVLRLHSDGADGGSRGEACLLDVGGSVGPGRSERLARARAEEAGEELRLLYVGLTRAQCSVVTWWAASARNTSASALHRVLSRGAETGDPARSYDLPADPVRAFTRPGLHVETVAGRTVRPWRGSHGGGLELTARAFDRVLDLDWRRTSYSALTSAAHGTPSASSTGVGSEVEVAWEDDEGSTATPTTVLSDAVAQVDGLDRPSPMQSLPSGVVFGTTVHEVLEAVDTGAGDLLGELRRVSARVLAGTRLDIAGDDLAEALQLVMQTPLGPLASGRPLSDIPRSDRLAELAFELPLAGGDRAGSGSGGRAARLGDLATLLRRHLSPTDPLAAYPDLLEHPSLADQSLRGYLTGSIDAVLRLRDPGADVRYLVVDYKTNWLGSVDGPDLRLADYRPERLATAMMAAHYPLQALLYVVAVHRMLRWRQPGYRPGRHLGGVLYLFVRGMAGRDTPAVDGTPCGVFGWRPPAELVGECSDLLDRGPT
jgi:exodeoxyribonuclease V beta subunit